MVLDCGIPYLHLRLPALALWICLGWVGPGHGADPSPALSPPSLMLPQQAIGARELAVIINDSDPSSREIGEYYQRKRNIPPANLIHVRFPPGRARLDRETFEALYRQVRAETPEEVQAYALAWTLPYQVGCMSVTSAFAFGYNEAFCAKGCRKTQLNPYFAAISPHPHSDYGMRPTMALAGSNPAATRSLIDRGLASDLSHPTGTAYLVETRDAKRNVRAPGYEQVVALLGDALRIKRIRADYLVDKPDVLFYFTGAIRVPKLSSNTFLPGAVADHLTSTGGRLTDSCQMSSLEWLDAGATGSYGSVQEPCNFPEKFPDPAILMRYYLSGSTLIEAYWASVLMPGQGVFIGDPLARPYGGYVIKAGVDRWNLDIYALKPGRYHFQAADDPLGPYRELDQLVKSGYRPLRLGLPLERNGYYRIAPME